MSAFSSLKDLFTKRESPKIDLHYSIAVMGERNVGKTSIISQFRWSKEPKDHSEYDIVTEVYKTHNANVTLNIAEIGDCYAWFSALKNAICRNDAFILVYSVDNQDSFDFLYQLRHKIIELKMDKEVPIVIVANKQDLPEDKKVVKSGPSEYLIRRKWRHGYVELTSSNYDDVCEVFKQAVRQLTSKVHLSPILERRRKSVPVPAPARRGSSVLDFVRALTKRSSI